jgi:hypothetical protein
LRHPIHRATWRKNRCFDYEIALDYIQVDICRGNELLQLLYRDRGYVRASARQAPAPVADRLGDDRGLAGARNSAAYRACAASSQVFDVFDKNPGPRTIKGLLYCREEIEAQYQEWLGLQVGRSKEETSAVAGQSFSREAIESHTKTAIDQLRNSKNKRLKEDFERAAVRLEELKNNLTDDVEMIDKSLNDIEHFLDHAILTNADKKHLKQWERETTAQLKAYKSDMPADAYEQTFRLMLLKRVREELGVPRLGSVLFMKFVLLLFSFLLFSSSFAQKPVSKPATKKFPDAVP